MYEIYCKLRDEKGIKDADVSRGTNITKSTFSDWKNGRSVPKQEKLQKIADYFGVSLDYLTTGEEPTLENYPKQAELLVKIRNDKRLFNAIEKYYALSDRKKEHVLDLIDLLGGGVSFGKTKNKKN